jgi:MinD-like ATPase involved in chromosome partitioning or flagellar assembly
LNRGVPFFLSNREAQVSQDIDRLAKAVTGPPPTTAAARPEKAAKTAAKNKSLFAWR